MLSIAKLEVPVINTTGHVVAETTGGKTGNSGLRPGAVAADGTVASLKSGAGTVLGVSRGTGLPTKELVSVESAMLTREAAREAARETASVMVAVGLQVLNVVVTPNGVVIGSGGTRGGVLIEGKRITKDDDKLIDGLMKG